MRHRHSPVTAPPLLQRPSISPPRPRRTEQKRTGAHPTRCDNDNDCDTLTENESNMCWACGPAGMSDGGQDPPKKHRKFVGMLSATGSWEPLETLRDDSVSRPVQRSQCEKKKGGCDKFGSISRGSHTDVKSVRKGRGVRGAFVMVCGILRIPLHCPGTRHTV